MGIPILDLNSLSVVLHTIILFRASSAVEPNPHLHL